MMWLGVFCVVAGVGMAVCARHSVRHRANLERFGGGLFLIGLGCAGADLALVS